MPCSKQIVQWMHDYLDGDIPKEEERQLRSHIQQCEACREHFYALEKTVAFVENVSHFTPSDDFIKKVMYNLPREKRRVRWKRWFTHHPFLTAASLFLLLSTSGLWAVWQEDNEFSFSKQEHLIVQNHTIIVPKGKVVEGWTSYR